MDKQFEGISIPNLHKVACGKWYTNSDYIDFIADHKYNHLTQIRIIALSGFIFQVASYFCIVLLLSFCIPQISKLLYLLLFAIIFVVSLDFIIKYKENCKSQPDFFLVLHPEKFRNIHPYKDDSIKK